MLLFTHPAMFDHVLSPGHPERPERLAAVLDAVRPFGLPERAAPRATRSALARVHPPAFLDALEQIAPGPDEGLLALDGDTLLGPGSLEAALRAAGAGVAATDAVLAGEDDMAFCAVRPPGHHAEPAQAMGFCIFSNAAVAALHALEAHGLARVAVVDFDVHHGNGTQAVAMRETRLFYASTHQSPLYPGTGTRAERGPADNVVNAPLPPRADGAAYRAAMEREIIPALVAWEPELIIVSAGFDAHVADPLAALELEDEDYAWTANALRAVALQACKGRIVSILEGGYDLPALSAATAAYVGALAAA